MSSVKAFEVGNTYTCRSACDYETIFSYTVVKRSSKFVVFSDRFGKANRRKVTVYKNVETCKPQGSYSMAPFLTAEDLQPVEPEFEPAVEPEVEPAVEPATTSSKVINLRDRFQNASELSFEKAYVAWLNSRIKSGLLHEITSYEEWKEENQEALLKTAYKRLVADWLESGKLDEICSFEEWQRDRL